MSRIAASARREPLLVLLVVLMAVVMSVYSVVRYDNFGAGLDLSLFDQAIWHYSHFQAPFSTIKGFDLLGDHFHPAVALLAPVFWVWSDPRMLLIAASVLVAGSTVPVFMFARDRLGRLEAYLVAVAYAAFWGLQAGVGYEFHESELGPPLIALAILLADRRRWGWFYVVIVLTLGVKEDLSIFVAFFGIYLLTVRQWWRGAALILIGIAWYVFATRVAIPDFSAIHGYTYWSYTELGRNVPDAIWALVKAPWRLLTIVLSPSVKAHTLLYLFAPFLFLSVFSRWFILAIPLLAERFLSTRSAFWGTDFMYSLTIAPVLAISAAQGLANVQRWFSPKLRLSAPLVAGAMAITSIALTFSLSNAPFSSLTSSSFYRTPWFKAAADRAIAHVPSGAPVTANDSILTHLNHREFASEITYARGLKGYLVADLGEPVGQPTGNANFAGLGQVLTGQLTRTTPVYYSDDWLVAKLPAPGQAPTNGVLTPLPRAIASRVRSRALSWQIEYFRGFLAEYGCYKLRVSSASETQHCPTAPYSTMRTAEHRLLSALRDAQQVATGGCQQLAGRTSTAVREIAYVLFKLHTVDHLATRGEFLNTLAQLTTVTDNRDLPGRLNRFIVLCYPRS